MGDVGGSSHAPGRHRGEIGISDFSDVGVALNRDEAGRDRVDGDAERGEFAGLAVGEADLCALGGGVGGPAGRRPVGDFGVDVHEAAEPSGLHPGQHRAAKQHRALDEEVQLGKVVGPRYLGHLSFRLRAGGVEH